MEFFFILATLALVFLFVLAVRFLQYRETLALAERGLIRPRGGDGRDALRWGIVITFLGLATTCGLYPVGWLIPDGSFPLNFGPWMLVGLVPTAFGLSLLVVYAVTHRRDDDAAAADAVGSSEPAPDFPEAGA